MPPKRKYPQRSIPRTLLYIRTLEDLNKQSTKFISSQKLAEMTGFTDVQIRKDISQFSPAGKPRVGYEVKTLKLLLEEYVQRTTMHVALFGVGNLGSAILKYPEFQSDKIKVVAAFEKNPKIIGKTINGVEVYAAKDAPKIIPKCQAKIGIIATPKESSQETADLIVHCGLKGIINFAPTSVTVPKNVSLKNIDLSIEFWSLFHNIGQ